jgi:uncharacterized membrane-anchored protein
MRMLRVAIFAAVALIQLSVPASIVWKREQTLKHGRVWKFKTEPVDPIDAIRGRYVALSLAASKIRKEPAPPETGTADSPVYAILKEDSEGFAYVEKLSLTPIAGDNIVKIEVHYWTYDGWENVRFPFDRFWVTEKIAPEAERAYRENSRRDKQNAYVTVRVRSGDAALEQLYIDGQPLVDYLRAHPRH